MKSIGLTVSRADLLQALVTLGVTRRRRFRSVVPVWLDFDPKLHQLAIVEERGAVTAMVRAEGKWPPAGATIDLYAMKRAVERHPDDPVALMVAADSIVLAGEGWHARLSLRKFGPESAVHDPLDGTPADSADHGHPLADLPLFRWAGRQS